MKKEIDLKLKIIKNKNKKLYTRIFIVSGLKGQDKFHSITYDENVCERVDNLDLALLGDNVLKLIFSCFLYNKKYSSVYCSTIGITNSKEKMENNNKFFQIVEKFKLDEYYKSIFLEYKYELQEGDKSTFFEAIIGAFFLQFGFNYVEELILNNIEYFM